MSCLRDLNARLVVPPFRKHTPCNAGQLVGERGGQHVDVCAVGRRPPDENSGPGPAGEHAVDHRRRGAEIVGRVGQPLDGGTVEMAGDLRLGGQHVGQRPPCSLTVRQAA